MRQIYTLLFSLFLPVILLRLYWRGFKAPEYRCRWRERLGFYASQPCRGVIWFHAVSVGEAEAVFPLVRLMQARYPQRRFLITTTTPTGSARVRAVLSDSIEHVYLPYDVPSIVRRFLDQFQPVLAVVMEKEVWPNLFAACLQRNIPLYVINARLSAHSAARYRKIPALIQPALDCIKLIATQTEDDRRRFVEIGAAEHQVRVLGNIKFDLAIAEELFTEGRALKQELFARRFIWILASSHDDEEQQLLPIYEKLKREIPELLLVIAPRHPERFKSVQAFCVARGLSVAARSDRDEVSENTDIYLADTMGELKKMYVTSDVAFVGGSLVAVGGHNILEPAAVGVPVLFGSHMFNFQEIAVRILQANAAVACTNVDAVFDAVLKIYRDPAYGGELAKNAQAFVAQNQGATIKTADMLAEAL